MIDGRTERDKGGCMIPNNAILGLTPLPHDHVVWQQAKPWKIVRSMLAIVFLCFLLSNVTILIAAGFLDANFNYVLGPVDSILVFSGGLCSLPLIALLLLTRKPQLTHSIVATPQAHGSTVHPLGGNLVVQTPVPTHVRHHLVRTNIPLDMPKTSHLWMIFIFGVVISTLCLLPLALGNINIFTILLAIFVLIPAWLIGFSTPVFGWWSITSRHMGFQIGAKDGELMLMAGMLAGVPAIIINSLLSPIAITTFGIPMDSMTDLGYGMILFLSAPIGEEISKALAVLLLFRYLETPRHGFYVGSTVGLGFALVENAQYIMGSLAVGDGGISFLITSIIRGIGSIPGHALWTGISGYAIASSLRWKSRDSHSVYDFRSSAPKTEWVLFEKSTGQVVSTSRITARPSDWLSRWVMKHRKHAWNLPTNWTQGLIIAILGHAFWNGSSWAIGLLEFESVVLYALVNIGWIVVLVTILWLAIVRIVPPIFQVEMKNEVDPLN